MRRLLMALSLVAALVVVVVWSSNRPADVATTPAEAASAGEPASPAVQSAGAEIGDISPDALQERIEAGTAPVILDVRTAEEYEAGHVPGALNMSHDELAARLGELGLDPAAELVVYCRSGHRAGIAEELLGRRGFTQLRDLDGHWLQWVEDGRPTE